MADEGGADEGVTDEGVVGLGVADNQVEKFVLHVGVCRQTEGFSELMVVYFLQQKPRTS